jgi:hypothetical protein
MKTENQSENFDEYFLSTLVDKKVSLMLFQNKISVLKSILKLFELNYLELSEINQTWSAEKLSIRTLCTANSTFYKIADIGSMH